MAIIHCNTYKNSCDALKDSCITFGVFDGVHQGHIFEIEQCLKDAKANNKDTCLITFDIDPDEIFKSNHLKLMSNSQRIKSLDSYGIDNVVVLEFNEETKNVDPVDFLDTFFGKNVPYSIHIGQGFKFGKKQQGNTKLLETWGKEHGMKVNVHKLLKKDGHIVSSTYLREQLKNR